MPEWLRTGAFKLLYVGRLVEQKRVDLLIAATGELRQEGIDLQLAICGTGGSEAQLRELAEKNRLRLGLDVHFLGYVRSWQAIAPHFDLFVLPSVAEGMPNVLVEAMGLGLPTVATEIFEISSFVEHEKQSVLVEPNNLKSLKAAISRLYNEPRTRERIAEGGQQLAKSLSVAAMVEKYKALYREMIDQFGCYRPKS